MHKIFKRTFLLTGLLYLCGTNKVFFGRKLRITQAVVCISFAICLLFLHTFQILNRLSLDLVFWSVLHSLEYIQLIIVNVTTTKSFMKNFEAKLKSIEDNITDAKYLDVVVKINIVMMVFFAYKLLHVFVLLKPEKLDVSFETITLFMSEILLSCAELEGVWRMFLMMIVKNKIDEIHGALKKIYPKEWFETDKVGSEVDKDIKSVMDAYKTLTELTQDIANQIQVSLIHRVASDMTAFFVSVYYFTKMAEGCLIISYFTVLLVVLALLSLSPCILFEMIRSKSTDLKMILIQQSLKANIKSKEKLALKRFTNFIVEKPIRLRIFGSYGLGSNFIVHYFQFVITYSIFILQTAKYKFF